MILQGAALRVTIATLGLICAPGMSVALAQDASPWDAEAHAAARLIAGATFKSGNAALLRAGVEIRLEPGWKTYWRYSGDSGVPPTLDFAGSENIKSVTILWPAPERFDDGAGGKSIGYRGDVVLPLRIVAKDETEPTSLHVKLGYAICGKLCAPAEADLAIALSGDRGSEEALLVAAEARVPRRVPLGAGNGLAIRSVHREPGAARERVVVDVAVSEKTPVDLLVEGPSPEWALPLPEPTGSPTGSPGLRRFTFDLEGLPPGAHAEGATLTLTAITPGDAIEVHDHLD